MIAAAPGFRPAAPMASRHRFRTHGGSVGSLADAIKARGTEQIVTALCGFCEAVIASRRSGGRVLVRDEYADGGTSGKGRRVSNLGVERAVL